MAIKTSSWTEQEQKVYNLVTANKATFIKRCAETCKIHTMFTFYATTGWQNLLFTKYYKTNPNKGDWILCVGRALHGMYIANDLLSGKRDIKTIMGGMKAEEELAFYERLAKRFYKVVHKRWLKMKKAKKPYEENTDTESIRELLRRGFVHINDVEDEAIRGEYRIMDKKYSLAWPKSFGSLTTASAHLDAWGFGECYYYQIQ